MGRNYKRRGDMAPAPRRGGMLLGTDQGRSGHSGWAHVVGKGFLKGDLSLERGKAGRRHWGGLFPGRPRG